MKLYRIVALVYRDLLIIQRSKWRLAELFYFPVTTIVIWGLFSVYTRSSAFEAGLFVLIINVFWNFAYVSQSTVNLQMLEDNWSGGFKQLMLSGITEVEYVVARMITSSIISILVLAFMLAISYPLGWHFTGHLGEVIVLSLLTLVTSLSMGVLITGLIVVLGRSYGFLAWTALQAFILLSAPFFPKDLFPVGLEYLAEAMPYTYIFASARGLASGEGMLLGRALITTLAYLVLVWPIYLVSFRIARVRGTLVRLS